MSEVVLFRLVAGVMAALVVLSGIPTAVTAQESAAWVLVETTVNPGGETFPHGSETGEVTGPPVEGAYEGTVIGYDVSPTSMAYRYKSVYNGVEYFDGTWTVSIDPPPSRLTPGETVQLSATSTGSGSVSEDVGLCSAGTQFEFRADGVRLEGPTQQRTCLDFAGGTISPSFTVPDVHEGGEIRITAFLWNCGACDVEWVYRPSGTAPMEAATPTSTPEDCLWDSVSREREQVGTFVGVFGDVEIAVQGCDQWAAVERGMPVYRDDVIRTGPNGRARVERLAEPIRGSRAVVNIGPNTELATEPLRHPDYTYWELFTGRLHYWAKNWGRQSIFTVKAGVTLCGIRGSEVLFAYDADTERVDVYVKAGVVNVTDGTTGTVTEIAAGHRIEIATEGLGTVASLTEDEWTSLIESSGVDVAGLEDGAPALATDTPGRAPEDGAAVGTDGGDAGATTVGPPLDGFTAPGALLAVLGSLALARRRRGGTG